MTITQQELTQYFQRLLCPQLFDDYAPNGIQIEGSKIISRLGFAVSATQDSIQKALSWGAQGLVVHHGVFWKHQGARVISGGWGERIKLCVKNDLNLFAYHLPLDAHPEIGNAASLAREIGLISLTSFAQHKGQPLGVKGIFENPLSAKALKEKLSKILHREVILASHNEKEAINSLGIITGGANNEWIKAKEEKLDAYLTGEISEYNWHDAIEDKIHYFAGGHHATERFGINSLKEKVERDFPHLEVIFFDSANPA